MAWRTKSGICRNFGAKSARSGKNALTVLGSKQSFASRYANVRFGPNLLEGIIIDWTSRVPGAVLYRQGALGIMHGSGKLPVLPALPGSPSTSPGTPGVVTGENYDPTKRTGF